ncbi:MAG: cystathionine beta-lyase [Devosia sp.]|uniref:cystathionine beta-lyase n=2 Tax=Devosia sp. TaxID=1871048 RepID=UPI001ACAADD3|nr:cystathionine beta-lyase [Devosia sp.]MBN9314663.1 cystathionine beta-lyase [Devosia sp.]
MTEKDRDSGTSASPESILTHSGRASEDHLGFVNMPVFRGSTILFRTLDELEDYGAPYRYGRNDNPTTLALGKLVSELEGAEGTVIAPSGLSAVTTAILATVAAGDEILISDSAYDPTRVFSVEGLSRYGIGCRFYDPRIGAGIADLITDRTKAVYVESPGSLTFEIQDLPAIAAAAHARGATVISDNSWATPLYHRPLQLGADIVVHAATKMFVGHSDAMVGTASANAALWPRLKRTHRILGVATSPDDSYLTLRGMRTLAVRMKEHGARSLELAAWLQRQPGVEEVYHPGLPTHPDHDLFKRDFSGSGSLFAMRLREAPRAAIAAMVNGLQLFGMGYSWGGYESLCIPFNPSNIRTAVPWDVKGQMFRVHVGLEGFDDLKADMSAALARYNEASA